MTSSSLFEDINNIKTEFPESEKFPRSGMPTSPLRLGLKANVCANVLC